MSAARNEEFAIDEQTAFSVIQEGSKSHMKTFKESNRVLKSELKAQ